MHDADESSPLRRCRPRILRWLIPNGGTLLIVAMLLITQTLWAKPFAAPNAPGPSATTINYQGHLADPDGNPLDGAHGMSFALYDAATGGNLVWGPEEHTAVEVSDGLFSVGLGSKTSGGIPTTTWNGDRYLEITVGGETLTPRELIRSVPIAGMALTVPDGAITTDKIDNNAVTNVQTVVVGPRDDFISTTSKTFEDIPDYEITMETTGGPVLLTFQGVFGALSSANDNDYVKLDFTIDGVRVSQNSVNGINQIVSSLAGRAEQGTTLWIATPPAGTHTFHIQWRSGTGNEVFLNNRDYATQFTAIELKR